MVKLTKKKKQYIFMLSSWQNSHTCSTTYGSRSLRNGIITSWTDSLVKRWCNATGCLLQNLQRGSMPCLKSSKVQKTMKGFKKHSSINVYTTGEKKLTLCINTHVGPSEPDWGSNWHAGLYNAFPSFSIKHPVSQRVYTCSKFSILLCYIHSASMIKLLKLQELSYQPTQWSFISTWLGQAN